LKDASPSANPVTYQGFNSLEELVTGLDSNTSKAVEEVE
jgi:hypothetical protein